MGKKRNKHNERRQPSPAAPAARQGNRARLVAIPLLVLGAGVFLYALSLDGPAPSAASRDHGHDHIETNSSPQRAPGQTGRYRYFESAEDAHPLPVTLPPSAFPAGPVANAYAIAKEIPEVLAQQPCLCGCDNPSDDHRSLLDCYADEHAATCMVCIKEAVYAKQMTDAGESASWIRDAIVRHEFSDVNVGD